MDIGAIINGIFNFLDHTNGGKVVKEVARDAGKFIGEELDKEYAGVSMIEHEKKMAKKAAKAAKKHKKEKAKK